MLQLSLDFGIDYVAFKDFKIFCGPERKYNFPFLDASCVLTALQNSDVLEAWRDFSFMGAALRYSMEKQHAKLQLAKLKVSTSPSGAGEEVKVALATTYFKYLKYYTKKKSLLWEL